MKLLCLFTFLLTLGAILQGCGSATLTPAGAQVQMVNAMTPSDLLTNDAVGSFQSIGMNSVADCDNDLRNQAAQVGADFIEVTSIDADYCNWDALDHDSGKICYTAYAEAYRRKANLLVN